MTHDAVIVSLMRYAMGFVASCLPGDLFRKLDTMIINIAARKIGGLGRTTRIEALHFLSGTLSMSNLYAIHCAELLDSSLRAANSHIQIRLEQELCAYLRVGSLRVREIRINIPDTTGMRNMPVTTPPFVWERTIWTCTRYEEIPQREHLPRINSSYTCHAEEINKFTLYSEGTYTFANTFSWLDVGLQILLYTKWTPECSRPNKIDLDKILPPREGRKYLSPGFSFDEDDIGPRERDSQGRFKKELTVYAGMAIMGDIGATACIIKMDSITVHRGLHVHGTVISKDRPAYLEEVVLVHALRTLHDWLLKTNQSQENLQSMTLKAGTYQTIGALSNWFEAGTLTLRSEAASVLAEDLRGARNWLK